MLTVILFCALAAIFAGVACRYVLAWIDDDTLGSITPTELVVGSLICSIVVVPLITLVGFHIARSNTVSYNEYWGGFEKKAVEQVTRCTRDGSCRYDYQCDPYTEIETYTVTVSDGNGKSHTETRTRLVTKYHQCPYVDAEYTFEIETTLGSTYTIGSHWFPSNPQQHRWRGGRSLPRVPSGKPEFWVQAKQRIDSGNPGGVTERHKYPNFIQASSEDIYQKYSDAISTYRKAKLMPKVVTKVHDFYLADKAYFPTGTPDGSVDTAWQEAVMRLDGKIGSKKQADLHLVMVDSTRVPDADQYSQALEAYWQSKALGKNTISKNGLVIIVGYAAGKVDWARAFTGMPVGNEGLEVAVRENLPGVAADPTTLTNAIDTLIFAQQPDGFKRVQMASYKYLFATIQPTTGQKIVISIVAFFISLLIWAAFVYVDLNIPINILKHD